MKKEDLQKLTDEELYNKKRGLAVLVSLMIPLTIALAFFGLRGYWAGEELDLPTIIIAICTLGGAVSVYDDIKKLNAEMKERKER